MGCRRLFDAIDEDGDENLTIDELQNACEDPWLGRQLQVLDITSDNAAEIFKMMDTGDGLLSLDEFFEGTKRMQGPAEGRDMVRVLAITERLARGIKENVTGTRRDGMSSASVSSALPLAFAPRQAHKHNPQDILQKLDSVCKAVEAL